MAHPGVAKVAFTGSTSVGKKIREATAGQGKALTLELGGKSPYIVFDDADLDSAVEGLVDAIWFNQGQVCCAGSRLLVQEGVADRFHAKLKRRMDGLRIGDPLDKCIDIGAIVDPIQLQTITDLVNSSDGEKYRAATPVPPGCFYPPTLITGLSTASRLMQDEIFGPVLVSMTFRTPAEAVELANNTRYGLAASVWSENINLALDVAPKLKAGVVWVNGTNMFDAATGFGGVRESGFGREGGWEGLMAYLKPAAKTRPLKPVSAVAARPTRSPPTWTAPPSSSSAASRPAPTAAIPAPSGRPRAGFWATSALPTARTCGTRSKPRRPPKAGAAPPPTPAPRSFTTSPKTCPPAPPEFAGRIKDMTGKDGGAEVDTAIQRLFTYAAWADKYEGAAKPVPMRGLALALPEPVGVIAALCPDEAPLLGLVSLMAPAIAMGNTCVLVASDPFPLSATDFYQVLETSDLPAGVVNILTGSHGELAKPLAGHMDVDAIWSFSATPAALIERESATNLKRTWVANGQARDWSTAEGREFLMRATEVKTVWVPYGE